MFALHTANSLVLSLAPYKIPWRHPERSLSINLRVSNGQSTCFASGKLSSHHQEQLLSIEPVETRQMNKQKQLTRKEELHFLRVRLMTYNRYLNIILERKGRVPGSSVCCCDNIVEGSGDPWGNHVHWEKVGARELP